MARSGPLRPLRPSETATGGVDANQNQKKSFASTLRSPLWPFSVGTPPSLAAGARSYLIYYSPDQPYHSFYCIYSCFFLIPFFGMINYYYFVIICKDVSRALKPLLRQPSRKKTMGLVFAPGGIMRWMIKAKHSQQASIKTKNMFGFFAPLAFFSRWRPVATHPSHSVLLRQTKKPPGASWAGSGRGSVR